MSSTKQSLFHRRIALPQDHGSWVFILSPLLIGLFVGGRFTLASIYLVCAAMSAFLIRQPATIMIKAFAGRRSRTELPAALFWIFIYGLIILITIFFLVQAGFSYIFYLAIPGFSVFAWHLYLVSKRAERRQPGVEIVATGVLCLSAPTAFWIELGRYDSLGWALWVMTWLQSAASIVYVYLRLEQSKIEKIPDCSAKLMLGRRALLYTTFNLLVSFWLSILGGLPRFIFAPYLLQWLETLWGTMHPAIGVKPTAIGVRQLIVSILFTIVFIVLWKV